MNQVKLIFSWPMIVCFVMGFSSGLPLLLIGSTLQAWMTTENVDLSIIGAFSLVGLPYTFKFLWSPVFDYLVPPIGGRRKSWIFILQICLFFALCLLSFSQPKDNIMMLVFASFLLSFFSASQDIVIDAYRRESLADEELGLGSSMYINGYRIAMYVSGAVAIGLADFISWKSVYQIMALIILFCAAFTFFVKEPLATSGKPKSVKEAIIDPFKEFFSRHGAITLLVFFILYKVGDNMASNMTVPFLLKGVGFTKTDYAVIAKSVGLVATLAGGFIGGIMMLRMGIIKSLWFFGILQAVSTTSFIALVHSGADKLMLTYVIGFENLSSGMGTSAFAAFMASMTNRKFTATQYALLSSFMGIPRVLISAPTGWLAEKLGWNAFFLLCAFVAIPGLLLITKLQKLSRPE